MPWYTTVRLRSHMCTLLCQTPTFAVLHYVAETLTLSWLHLYYRYPWLQHGCVWLAYCIFITGWSCRLYRTGVLLYSVSHFYAATQACAVMWMPTNLLTLVRRGGEGGVWLSAAMLCEIVCHLKKRWRLFWQCTAAVLLSIMLQLTIQSTNCNVAMAAQRMGTVASQLWVFIFFWRLCVFPVSCGLFLWQFGGFPLDHVRLIPSLYSWALAPDLDQVPRYYTLAAFSQG